FKNGEFEKALITYQKLYETNPNNYNYIFQLIKTQQQLRHLDDAEQLIKNKLSQYNNPALIVELGYNYQLKDSIDLANSYYDEAVSKIKEKPIFVYNVARQFEEHSLLDYAILAYKTGMVINPELNFNIQLARIY